MFGPKPLKIAICLLLVSAWTLPPLYAQSGKQVVQEVVTLLSAPPNRNGSQRSIYEAVNRHMNYEDMCANLLTSKEWEKLPAAKKQRIQTMVQKLIEKRYYPRWQKLFSKGKIAFVGEAEARQDVYVKTHLTIGKKESQIVWHLRPKLGEMTILSLAVGRKDLLASMTTRFQRHLKEDGIDGVIVWLRDKLDEEEVHASGPTSSELK
jgi:ABC-type transporter MlaC component